MTGNEIAEQTPDAAGLFSSGLFGGGKSASTYSTGRRRVGMARRREKRNAARRKVTKVKR